MLKVGLVVTVLVSVVPLVLCSDSCDVRIARYCCSNVTLDDVEGFKLSCYSDATGDGWSSTGRNRQEQSVTDGSPISTAEPTREMIPAFEIGYERGRTLTVKCATAAPNFPSLLDYLGVRAVDDLSYTGCEVPQGNLSFADIFDGNSISFGYLALKDPVNISNGILRGSLFNGVSSSLQSFIIHREASEENFDLSDDFFESFTSLSALSLEIGATNLPSSLNSLTNLTELHLSKAQIGKVASAAFCGLKNLRALHLIDVPIAKFGSEPFSDLSQLRSLQMSGIHVARVRRDTFFNLTDLAFLKIMNWPNLIELELETFGNTPRVVNLQLSKLPRLKELPRGLLRGLAHLRSLVISKCGLESLPMLPEGGARSNNLFSINIGDNQITALPDYFLDGNEHLQNLNIERNRLRRLGKGFHLEKSKQTRLSYLDLSRNSLEYVSREDFKDLKRLTSLNLEFNVIEFIETRSFEELNRLEILFLNDNRLKHFGQPVPLVGAVNRALKKIFLSNNNIREFPDLPFRELKSLEVLDLDNNLISELDIPLFSSPTSTVLLRRNKIAYVSMSRISEIRTKHLGHHIFHIDGNPLQCNGRNYDFLSYIQKPMRPGSAEFRSLANCFCSDTGQKLVDVHLEELFTKLENCPSACECLVFPANVSTHVRCRHKNLTTLPELPQEVTDLDFEGNALISLPESLSTHSALQVVNLNRNRLQNIDKLLSHAPLSLRFLYMEFNEVKRIDVDSESILKFSVALANNPWICDCGAKNFKLFLDANARRILNYSGVKCKNFIKVDGKEESSLSRIPLESLCPRRNPTVMILVASFLFILGLMLFTIILFLKHRNVITVFIFVHFNSLFRFLSNEKDCDGTKRFDAFLCYAQEDRDVAMEIIRTLESSNADTPSNFGIYFKLCFHERDFIPGESISWNIVEAVQTSHRTMMILSERFLSSPWFKFEFETAYDRMFDDQTNRLIMVVKGDIPKSADLNEKLRAVLSTKTYLVWGERWFWKKLLYTMPHKRKRDIKTSKL